MSKFANRQGAACKALTPGTSPLMTGCEAVVLGVGDQGEDVVKTEFWKYTGRSFGWRARVSGTVT
jgi:hypothetical protein